MVGIDELSDIIHNAKCGEGTRCTRYDPPQRPSSQAQRAAVAQHRNYYRKRARALADKLEPVVGENVIAVVRITLEELG
jgi:hypothetical protein